MKRVKLNLSPENGTLSMINQTQILNYHNANVLKSNLCNYNDAYILVRGHITFIENGNQVGFKNCAANITCITRMDGTTIDDAEDLDFVMPMYSLLEYSSNYFDATGSLWFYCKDEAIHYNANIANTAAYPN